MNSRDVLSAAGRRAAAMMRGWFSAGPSRVRLRRRLILFTAPIALLALLAVVKMIAVVLVGDSAVTAFERHDIVALRDDVSRLRLLNIIEPQRLPFTEGDLRVLEGRLAEADERFAVALSRTERSQSCPVRVNLELVRETRGDLAARDADIEAAEQQYRGALAVVQAAPERCFHDNADPNEDRRKIREEAEARLQDKIDALHLPPSSPPAPPPTPTAVPPPTESLTPTSGPPLPELGGQETTAPSPPPSRPPRPDPDAPAPPGGGPVFGPGSPVEGPAEPGPLNDVDADRLPTANDQRVAQPDHRLDPERGEPLERLQEVLGNSNASGSNSE